MVASATQEKGAIDGAGICADFYGWSNRYLETKSEEGSVRVIFSNCYLYCDYELEDMLTSPHSDTLDSYRSVSCWPPYKYRTPTAL